MPFKRNILGFNPIYLVAAETAMGKPLFKASEGGHFDVLEECEDVTKSEVLLVSKEHVLTGLKVRLEAFRTGLPMSV